MGNLIAGRTVQRLHIIDDDEGARSSYVETFYNSRFETVSQGGVEDVEQFLALSIGPTDAIISDHQLTKRSYFPINGAEVVSKCYERRIPSVLVTKYDKTQMSEIRRFRQKIPVIINPSDFDEDVVYNGLEVCIKEFSGQIRPDRKLWRALARVDSTDESHIYIVIPNWDPTEVISIPREELPVEIQSLIEIDKRLHVHANLDCETINDLYFDPGTWEKE